MRSKFGARALRYGQGLMEFSGAIPFEAFGNIGHHRFAGIIDLHHEPQITGKWSLLRR